MKINEFRLSKKLSVRAFAEQIGLSQSSVAKVCYEQRTPSINFLKKLKEAFPEVDLNEYIGD